MKNKNTSAKKETPVALVASQNGVRAAVKSELESLLDAGEIDIPDECVEGKLTTRLVSLESQVKSLTARMAELSARLEGKPGVTARVDVTAEAPKKKGKK